LGHRVQTEGFSPEGWATLTTHSEGWACVTVSCGGVICRCCHYLRPGPIPPINPIFTGLGLSGSADYDRELAWNPDGTVLVGRGGSAYAYDIPEFQLRSLPPGGTSVGYVTCSPITNDVFLSDIQSPHRIAAVNCIDGSNYRVREMSSTFHPSNAAWGGGNWVAVTNAQSGFYNEVRIYNGYDLTGPTATMFVGDVTHQFKSIDFRGNYVVAGKFPEVTCWYVNSSNGSASQLWSNTTLNGNIGRTSVRISPDLSKVAVLSRTSNSGYSNVHILSMTNGALITQIHNENGNPESCDWSPDGSMLVVISDSGRILDGNNLSELYHLNGVGSNDASVAWSSQNLIATNSAVWAPFDYSGPTITWSIPVNGSCTTLDSVRCQGTIYDLAGLSPTSPPQYQVNSGTLVNIVIDTTWHFDFYAHLSSGDNTIRMVATDRAGNPSEMTRRVNFVVLSSPIVVISTVVLTPTSNWIRLDWTDENAPLYRIYSSLNASGPFDTLGTSSDTTFFDIDPSDLVKYYIVVSACAP
jgi:hypothetical protein